MNLLGVEIRLSKNGYVCKSDCRTSMNKLEDTIREIFNHRVDDLMKHIDNRFEDFREFLKK